MESGRKLFFCILVACLVISASCSEKTRHSPLYILEELETASALDDPEARIERLEIFIGNHPEHPYRVLGYRRILKTLAEDLGDAGRATGYFDGILEKESDYRVRGDLFYSRFAHFWDVDREKAFSLAERLLEGPERYHRLFFYMGYYFTEDGGDAVLAERCLKRAIELAPNSPARAQVMGVLGEFLEKENREDEALGLLKKATADSYANEVLGRILRGMGDIGEALEAYIRLVASAPGAREDVGLDSLYALVYPQSSDLDEKIMELRILSGGALPGGSFVDIDGRDHDLADYRGSNLVLSIFSPT